MNACSAPLSPAYNRFARLLHGRALPTALVTLAMLMAAKPRLVCAGAFVAGTSTNITTIAGPRSVAVGDFNGDGIMDMVVGNEGGGGYSAFRGTGGGAYAARWDNATGALTGTVVVADFDGDGKLDLAMTQSNIARVLIHLGYGDVTFAPTLSMASPANPQGLVAADFNGDGKIDLAATGYATTSTGTVAVYLNTSSGPGNVTFAPRTDYACGAQPLSIAAGKLSHTSNLPDLITANSNANPGSSTILFNDGTGHFGNRQDLRTCRSSYAVAVGQVYLGLDRDQIVIANRDSASVTLLVYDEANTGWWRRDYAAAAGPRYVTIADADGDANQDVLVTSYDGNKVSVFSPNHSALGLNPRVDVTATSNPYSVAVGNLNGDLKPDLVFTCRGASNITMVRGAPKRGWALGDTIPTFTGVNQNGSSFSSAYMSGTWMLLDLCSVWCTPCKYMARGTQALYATWLGHPSVRFDYVTALNDGATVGTASTQADAAQWGNQYGITRHILHSGGVQGGGMQALAVQSELTATPTLRLIGPDGRVRWLQQGYAEDSTIARVLANLAGVAMPSLAPLTPPGLVSATETVTHGVQSVSSPSDPSGPYTFPYNVTGFGENFTSDFFMSRNLLAGTEQWTVNLTNYPVPGAMALATNADWQLTLKNIVLDPLTRTLPAGTLASVSALDTFGVWRSVPVTPTITWDGSTLTLGAVPAAALAALPPTGTLELDWVMRIGAPIAGAPDVTPLHALELRAPWPNPATGASRLAWSQPREAAAKLEVYDLNGRRLRTIEDRIEPTGEHAATWDLTDDQHARVGPGLYFARLSVDGQGTRTQRVIVVQ